MITDHTVLLLLFLLLIIVVITIVVITIVVIIIVESSIPRLLRAAEEVHAGKCLLCGHQRVTLQAPGRAVSRGAVNVSM